MDKKFLAEAAIDKAKRQGAALAEAFILAAESLTIEVNDGWVETLKLAEDNGIGIRIITPQGQMGFAFSSDLREAKVERIAAQAVGNARETFPDAYNRLPPAPENIPQMRIIDPTLQGISLDEKVQMACKLEEAAKAADGRIKRTERVVYEDRENRVVIANTQGLTAAYRTGYCGLYAAVLAVENGDTQSGMSLQYSRDFNLLQPSSVGKEAAEDAVRLLGAKSVASQRATLILSPYIATDFLSVLAPALTADAIQKGKSLFKGKMEQVVAASSVTIIDDGRLENGIASTPVDDEGVSTERTILIKDGLLRGCLHNTYTAAKAGVVSTGNGVRGTFKAMPEVGVTNFFINPGFISEADLISDVKSGLYVTSVMGMHTANPISGDFSVGAAGVWIENGKLRHAVRGVAVSGNILELLKNIDAVANNLRFFGGRGAPALRIQGMSISGS